MLPQDRAFGMELIEVLHGFADELLVIDLEARKSWLEKPTASEPALIANY